MPEFVQKYAKTTAAIAVFAAAINPFSAEAVDTGGPGIIGGFSGGNYYAALVSSSGGITPLPLFTSGIIDSVAINSSGSGLIGGVDGMTGNGYVAFVSSNGGLTPLLLPPVGTIYSVAINSNGTGLIGGFSAGPNRFAAFVYSSGVVTPLTLPLTGEINSVAINDNGAGIIGGGAAPETLTQRSSPQAVGSLR